jgi:Outer membrane protein beta-barrel domain
VTKAHQRLIVLIAVSVACAAVPSVAFAQRRMPHQEANAIGGEVGMFLPHADGMSTGPAVDGTFEHYLNARDSVRLNVGWMQPQQTGNPNAKMREVRVAGDLVHNWEGGSVHPFLGAGLGMYFLQPRVNGNNDGPGATKFGGTLLGGAEFFTSKTVAVKAEARYHIVTKSGTYDPSGLSLSVGLKSYF